MHLVDVLGKARGPRDDSFSRIGFLALPWRRINACLAKEALVLDHQTVGDSV